MATLPPLHLPPPEPSVLPSSAPSTTPFPRARLFPEPYPNTHPSASQSNLHSTLRHPSTLKPSLFNSRPPEISDTRESSSSSSYTPSYTRPWSSTTTISQHARLNTGQSSPEAIDRSNKPPDDRLNQTSNGEPGSMSMAEFFKSTSNSTTRSGLTASLSSRRRRRKHSRSKSYYQKVDWNLPNAAPVVISRVEFESLPPTIQRKYFTTLERLRFARAARLRRRLSESSAQFDLADAQDLRNLTPNNTPTQFNLAFSSSKPLTNPGPPTLLARRAHHRQLLEQQQLQQQQQNQQWSTQANKKASSQSSTSPLFVHLPEKIKRWHLSSAEQKIVSQFEDLGLNSIDHKDRALFRQSSLHNDHSQVHDPFPIPSPLSSPTASSCEDLLSGELLPQEEGSQPIVPSSDLDSLTEEQMRERQQELLKQKQIEDLLERFQLGVSSTPSPTSPLHQIDPLEDNIDPFDTETPVSQEQKEQGEENRILHLPSEQIPGVSLPTSPSFAHTQTRKRSATMGTATLRKDSFYETFRWLDEDDHLDLSFGIEKYDTCGVSGLATNSPIEMSLVDDTLSCSPRKSHTMSTTGGSLRRHLSTASRRHFRRSSMPLGKAAAERQSFDAVNTSSPGRTFPVSSVDGRPTSSANAGQASSSASKRRTRGLSMISAKRLAHGSISSPASPLADRPPPMPVVDPCATHYQDPEARQKLRAYLASPQKFDEALALGFPAYESQPRPLSTRQSQQRSGFSPRNRSNTFGVDQQTGMPHALGSVVDDDSDGEYEFADEREFIDGTDHMNGVLGHSEDYDAFSMDTDSDTPQTPATGKAASSSTAVFSGFQSDLSRGGLSSSHNMLATIPSVTSSLASSSKSSMSSNASIRLVGSATGSPSSHGRPTISQSMSSPTISSLPRPLYQQHQPQKQSSSRAGSSSEPRYHHPRSSLNAKTSSRTEATPVPAMIVGTDAGSITHGGREMTLRMTLTRLDLRDIHPTTPTPTYNQNHAPVSAIVAGSGSWLASAPASVSSSSRRAPPHHSSSWTSSASVPNSAHAATASGSRGINISAGPSSSCGWQGKTGLHGSGASSTSPKVPPLSPSVSSIRSEVGEEEEAERVHTGLGLNLDSSVPGSDHRPLQISIRGSSQLTLARGSMIGGSGGLATAHSGSNGERGLASGAGLSSKEMIERQLANLDELEEANERRHGSNGGSGSVVKRLWEKVFR